MNDIAIDVRGLGKKYRVGQQEQRYRALRDTLADCLRKPLEVLRNSRRQKRGDDMFWALKDVHFQVRQGEVIGIIGRNGAGKSTLLKIISRITEPTAGRISIRGRIGSLLEVGSGFHPELTGRENIYMNGAILGMRRAEIERKFDEIVEFAEVEKFLDSPVKHYSSGMYMRLAFAVAAHLDPEILVIDEVLAVGDAEFQRKCLGKMGDVARKGRTVLFVSHNLAAVENLCTSAVVLEHGALVYSGPTHSAISKYVSSRTESGAVVKFDKRVHKNASAIRFSTIEVAPEGGLAGDVIRCGKDFVIRVSYDCTEPVASPVFSIAIFSKLSIPIFGVTTIDLGISMPRITEAGCFELLVKTPNLMPDRYFVHIAVGDHVNLLRYDHITDAAVLDIVGSDVYGSGKLMAHGNLIYMPCEFQLGKVLTYRE
jgi:lipopolysaccharide transport system ATP-binding protein